MFEANLLKRFPRLLGTNFQITSPVDPTYNCIAWAAHDSSHWWEPDPMELYYWPISAPRKYTLEAYIQAFRSVGFEICSNESFEQEYEKVIIFQKNGYPTHASRQIDPKNWTSKLGKEVDINHTLDSLRGGIYGDIAVILMRNKRLDSNPDPSPLTNR